MILPSLSLADSAPATLRAGAAGLLITGLVALMVFAAPSHAKVQASDAVTANQGEEATLEEMLVNGLKVRTDGEKAFIARVVELVQEGKLSESLVKAIYQRARQQHSRYPLPYFVAILKQVAKQRGIEL